MCDICEWEALHPGETWPPPRIPEYGPPTSIGVPFTLQIAKPRDVWQATIPPAATITGLRVQVGGVMPVSSRIAAEVQERNDQRDAALALALADRFGVEEE